MNCESRTLLMACKFFQTVYELRVTARDARAKKSEQRIAHFEAE